MTCSACNGFGCPTCQAEAPDPYCADNPTEWCSHWDNGACDGTPRADGTCPYLDALREDAVDAAADAAESMGA